MIIGKYINEAHTIASATVEGHTWSGLNMVDGKCVDEHEIGKKLNVLLANGNTLEDYSADDPHSIPES